MYDKLLPYIKESDFSGDLALVASACGVDVAAKLAVHCRGIHVYIPSSLPRQTIMRYIADARADGRSTKQIAHALGVSERYIQYLSTPPAPPCEQLLLTDN